MICITRETVVLISNVFIPLTGYSNVCIYSPRCSCGSPRRPKFLTCFAQWLSLWFSVKWSHWNGSLNGINYSALRRRVHSAWPTSTACFATEFFSPGYTQMIIPSTISLSVRPQLLIPRPPPVMGVLNIQMWLPWQRWVDKRRDERSRALYPLLLTVFYFSWCVRCFCTSERITFCNWSSLMFWIGVGGSVNFNPLIFVSFCWKSGFSKPWAKLSRQRRQPRRYSMYRPLSSNSIANNQQPLRPPCLLAYLKGPNYWQMTRAGSFPDNRSWTDQSHSIPRNSLNFWCATAR